MNKGKNLRKIIFIFFSITLFISFHYDENSSGGSEYDYSIISEFILLFSKDITEGLLIYSPINNPHLPFFYIFLGKLFIFFDLNLLRLLYLSISLTLPIIIYKILKLKFKNYNKNILFSISVLIFLSPYFRSSAVWLTNDNLTLIFFCFSIYYFYKSDKLKSNNFTDILKCFLFLFLSVYLRQNFILFIIYYYYYLFTNNNNFRKFLTISLINLIFTIPILYYLFHYEHIYYYLKLNQSMKLDYSFNFLIFLNILLFYMIPFIISKSVAKILLFNLKNNLKIIFFLVFFVLFINYNVTDYLTADHGYGGGVFYKLFFKIINIPELFILFSIISLVLLFCLIKVDYPNYILILILFFLYSLPIIYQKYYDPLFLIMFFSLLTLNKNINIKLFNYKYLTIPFIYFFCFYLFTLSHYQ